MTVDAVGGVWRYACDLAEALGAHGVTCLLLGFGPPPTLAQRKAGEKLGNVTWVWSDAPLDWMATHEAALQATAPTIIAYARQFRPDVLHLNLPSQAVGIPVEFPVVAVAHSCVATWFRAVRGTDPPPEWQWQKQANLRGFKRTDAIVTPSRSHAASLRQTYGNLGPIDVIYNASSVSPAVQLQKEPIVFAAARWWDEGKNANTLDQAAAHIAWPVLAAGPLAGENGTAVRVANLQALGTLSSCEVVALMQRAAIFAAPSRYEPFGLAVLEAALCGAALVLADIPTFRELWEGAAQFVPEDDPIAWACAINALAAEPEQISALGAKAQARAGLFCSPLQAAAMLNVYRTAMSQRSPHLIGVS